MRKREFQVGDKIVTITVPGPDEPHWMVMLQEQADKIGLVYTPEQAGEVVEG